MSWHPGPVFLGLVVVIWAAVATTLATTAAADEPEDPPPAVGVWTGQLEGLEVVEAVLPGRPLAATVWPSGAGGLAVLTRAPVDGEKSRRSLYRVRGEAGDIEAVIEDLPEGVNALDRQGENLWLGADDGLWRIESDGESVRARRVAEQPGLDLEALVRGGLIRDQVLWLPEVGRLVRSELTATGLMPREELAVPVSAERRRRGLVLRSRPVRRLPGGQLIAGPETVGATRVRHLLIGDDGEETSESWSRLPGPEDIEQHWYLEIDGRPAFLAATTRADRLGVFEKLKLRVFRLTADRTRAGRQAMLAIETSTRNWYAVQPVILDFDRDGKDDLVLIQPEGLEPGDLVIDLHRSRAGRFDPKPRRSKLDAESARWHFGDDLDGDGVADLVVGTGKLAIYRGLENPKRRVLEKDPWKELDRGALSRALKPLIVADEESPTSDDRPSFRGRQRVVDLDGDGDLEIAVVRSLNGRTVVRLVDF